jgi:hypothetical protein
VTKFTISLAGGKKGLLQNDTYLCSKPRHATVRMDAQDNSTHDTNPTVSIRGCGAKHHRRHQGRAH